MLLLRRLLALALCVAGSLPPAALRADPPGPAGPALAADLQETLARSGDLTLRNTSLRDALFTIGQLWKINVVVGDEVEGQVNGVFQQAPLSEILDALLLSNGYSYRPVGQSLVVMKLEQLGELNPLFEAATLSVGAGDPADIVAGAKLLSSPRGQVQAIPSAGCLLVIDYPDRVARIRQFVASLPAQGPAVEEQQPDALQMAHFSPQFVSAVALKEAFAAALSKDGRVAVLERENRLVVIDHPAHLKLVEQMLTRLDVPRPQVRITAYIYDIALEDMHELGINWHSALKGRHNAEGNPQSLWAINSLTTVPFDQGAVAGAMTLANMSKSFDLATVIQALDSASDSRLLADPNIVVVNNEPAEIAIISEIPYQQLTQTSAGGNIGTTAFREAGVKLTVTPRIAEDGTVLLDVQPEFSRLTGFTPEDNQPIIDRRTARTQVRVANGHTLVIGGLKQRSDVGDFAGIPYLKDIPKIGFLFRSRSSTIRESELVVFLRPEIIQVCEPPRCREQAAAGAIEFHLDQMPVGQGYEVLPPGVPLPVEPVPAGEPIPEPAAEAPPVPQFPISGYPLPHGLQRPHSGGTPSIAARPLPSRAPPQLTRLPVVETPPAVAHQPPTPHPPTARPPVQVADRPGLLR